MKLLLFFFDFISWLFALFPIDKKTKERTWLLMRLYRIVRSKRRTQTHSWMSAGRGSSLLFNVDGINFHKYIDGVASIASKNLKCVGDLSRDGWSLKHPHLIWEPFSLSEVNKNRSYNTGLFYARSSLCVWSLMARYVNSYCLIFNVRRGISALTWESFLLSKFLRAHNFRACNSIEWRRKNYSNIHENSDVEWGKIKCDEICMK